MTTFCILCRSQIPADRQRRSARTCSPACHIEYRRQYRQERNARVCKDCGRPLRKKRKAEPGNSVPEVSGRVND